jgi:hypothetical protein
MSPFWLSSTADAWKPYRGLELTLTSPADNDWIILMIAGGQMMPDDATVTVGLEIPDTGGEGSILFTAESFDSIVANTASGTIWAPETVTETTYACFPTITGIRPIWKAGTIKVVIAL